MKNKIWLFLLAALVLAACSEDSEQQGGVRGEPLHLTAVTRTPSEAIIDADEDHSPIQIYLMSGTQKTEGNFIYNSPEWTSTIGVKELNNYIFGYSPATAAAGTISTITNGATDYSAGAKLTLNNLKAVGADDICVVVGVKNSAEAVTPDFGVFEFNKVSGNNSVCLLLDHLFSAIDFKIRIGENYNVLRDIRLKKMELKSSSSITQAVVTLTANTTGANPISVAYTQDATVSQSNVIYDYGTDATTNNGLLLTDTGTSFVSYCAPLTDIDKKLTLVCTYDVYNKKGTRVRENCTAENSFSGIKGLKIEPRKKNTVTLTVEPSYLYQLSEDELDNPTVNLNGE